MTYSLKPGPHAGTWIVDESGAVVVWCHSLPHAEKYLKEHYETTL